MTNRILSLIFLVLGIIQLSYSQNIYTENDSCSLLSYHSTMESDGFMGMCNHTNPDYLKMFLAVKPDSDDKFYDEVNNRIENEILSLKSKIAATKKPVKALKLVFTEIQNDFLKTYDVDAAFPEIFKSGKYNCLTATILYSLILEKLGYRYTPKVMPGHVYLLVYLENKPYIFETTDPINGFMEIDNEALRASIQSMRLFKYVESDNSENDQKGNLFDRYYLQLNTTDLRGLLGYHYVNEMVLYSIKQEPDISYELLKKALYLTPQDELAIIREQLLRSLLAEYSYRSTKRAEYIAEFFRISKNRNKLELVSNEFILITNQCLFTGTPAPDSLTAIYNILNKKIADSNLLKNINESYYSFMSAHFMLNENSAMALKYAYNAYTIAPDNIKTRSLFFTSLDEIVNRVETNQKGLDKLDSLSMQYPVITSTSAVKSKKCQIYLEIIRSHYENNRQALAEKYLTEFENQFAPDDPTEIYCYPAMVYSIAASFYFKKGNNAKARQVLKKGLEYSPNNYELEMKLKQIR